MAKEWKVHIGSAGNTINPCLLTLRGKSYALSCSRSREEDGEESTLWRAEKDDRAFSADWPEELLGLVAMWEVRGDFEGNEIPEAN